MQIKMILNGAKNIVIFDKLGNKIMTCDYIERINLVGDEVFTKEDTSEDSLFSSLEEESDMLDKEIPFEREKDELNPLVDLINVAKDLGIYDKTKGLFVQQIKSLLDVMLTNQMEHR